VIGKNQSLGSKISTTVPSERSTRASARSARRRSRWAPAEYDAVDIIAIDTKM
jgi:hypothetical protein